MTHPPPPRTRRAPRAALRVRPHPLSLALACALAATAPAGLSQAQTLPAGAAVVRGQASIVTHGQQMTVTSSPDAVLNWQSFSIGAGQTVHFQQPHAASQVLNRVLGRDPSQIAGRLSSNGTVWLLNPHGVLFGRDARVDVGALVASTLNISDADWQARRYRLTGGNTLAGAVVNQGEIRTTLGGQVLLVGGQAGVRNEGLIEAPGGQVMLAAGASVDLADSTSPQLAVRVTAPAGEAVNLGRLLAPGGRVDLQAAMVNQQGIVRADSLAGGPAGEVRLQARDDLTLAAGSHTGADGGQGGRVLAHGGTTLVAGAVSAQGLQDLGGSVRLLGQQVGLLAGADVNVSGARGGGEVLVGGGLQGLDPSVPNARATYMDAGAAVRADALDRGPGGRIVLWSDKATRAYGTLSARGGASGGDGGLIETSGGWLDARPASVRADAPRGAAGTWLLDPNDILISDGSVSNDNVTLGPDFRSTADAAVISTATIVAALDAGNSVTVTTANTAGSVQSGNIRMLGSLNLGSSSSGANTPVTLTLNASRHIDLDFVNIASLQRPLDITLNAGTAGAGGIQITGGSINTTGNLVLGGASTACGSAGCAGFTAATGTTDAGRGFGVSIQGADLTANRITARGASAIDTQPHGGVLIDSSATLKAAQIDLAGWAGSAAQSSQYGVKVSGLLQATDRLTLDGTSRISGPGSGSGTAVGVLLDGSSTIELGPSMIAASSLQVVAPREPDLRRALAADPNRFLLITGSSDTRSAMFSDSVSLGGNVWVGNKAGITLRGDGGLLTVGGSVFNAAQAGNLLVSGTGKLVLGASSLDVPQAEPTQLTNSGGVSIYQSLSGTPSDFTIDSAGTVRLGDGSGSLTVGLGSSPLTIRGAAFEAGLGGESVSVQAGRIAIQASSVDLGASTQIAAAASGDAMTVSGQGGSSLSALRVSGGGNPLLAPNGRWLVFASNPADSANFQPGGLAFTFKQYNATVGSGGLPATGNGLMFSLAPVLQPTGGVQGSTTKVYDGTRSSTATLAGGAFAGLLPGDQMPVSPTFGALRYASANVGTGIALEVGAVGGLPQVFDGSGRPVYGYQVSSTVANAQGTIDPRTLTIENLPVLDKVYDGTRAVSTQGARLGGVVPGEALALVPGNVTFDTADAGAGKPVTGQFALADGAGGLASNYRLANGGLLSTTADITRRPVTVSSVTAADKVYDGTATVDVAVGALSGVVAGQNLTVNTGAVAFDTPNAGTGKAVSGSLTLADGSGPDAGRASNYRLTNGGALALTGTIHPRPVGFAATAVAGKVYDGTVLATTQAGDLQGLVAGESIAATVTGRFQDSQAGADKPVFATVTLADGPGGLASNYVFPGGGFSARASISPRPVTVQGVTAADKPYDGTTRAVLSAQAFQGVVAGETLTLAPGTVAFDTAQVGTGKPVAGRFELADGPGGQARNYRLTDGGVLATTADITPRPVTVAGATVADKLYDGTAAASVTGGTLVGLVDGQSLTLQAGATTFDTPNAGINKPVSGALALADGTGPNAGQASNYRLTNGSTLSLTGTIHPRPVGFASTTVADKVYDGTVLATTQVGALQGLVPGEALLASVTGRFPDSQVGTNKPVFATVTLADGLGGLASNYVFPGGGFSARATISPRPVTVLGVAAADKPYDGTTTAALTAQAFQGVVPGESLTLAGLASFDTRTVGSGKTVTGRIALADGSGLATNYVLLNPGTFSGQAGILPRGLTVTGATAADKVYDGTPATTAAGFTLTGMLAGEQVAVSGGTGRFADPNVGTAKAVTATATGLTGADAGNYTLASPSVQTRASISPATATYVAAPTIAEKDIPLPLLGGTVGGLVPGDTVDNATTGRLSFTTTATSSSAEGVYPVVGSGLSARNYVFAQAPSNASALSLVRLSTSTMGEPTATVPTTPTLVAAIQPPPVVSSVAAHRALDVSPALQSAPQSVVFRALALDAMASQDVAGLLAARDRYKKGVFAEAIRELERNAGAADAPACQTAEQAAAGNCLITEALKPALRARLQMDAQPVVVTAPTLTPPPAASAAPAAAPTPPPAAPPAATAPLAAAPAPAPALEPRPAMAAAEAVPRARPLAAPLPLPPVRAVRSAALPQIQRKWALLIGTDVYADVKIPQLDNAVADVNAVAAVLEDKLGYQTLVVRNGTKAEILRAFNQLAAVVSPADSVAIYYAGHGELVEKLNLGFWQPSDADATRAETWISNTDIGKLLGQLGASQVVLVSDSCFSGSLVSDERIRAGSAVPDAATLLSRRAAVVMSSGGNEPVFDSGKNGHSTFAWSLMRALEGVASWRPGSNVFEQVRFAVARQVPQRPQYGASRLGGHQTGADYVFEQRQLDRLTK